MCSLLLGTCVPRVLEGRLREGFGKVAHEAVVKQGGSVKIQERPLE